MAKGTTYVNDYLKLVFQATTIAGLAQNAAGGTANMYVALHTADPSAGNQNTNEVAYTGYGRVAVARTSVGWTVTANNTTNNGAITFPLCTGGSNTAAFVSIGENTTGTGGEIYYAGALTATLAISNGITPAFNNAALTVSET